MFVYYPSCNFKRANPEAAKRIADWMAAWPDVRVTGCCHLPASRPEPGETLVTVCMSCMRMLTEEHPDLAHLSLFEFILTRPDFPWPDLRGRTFVLQDCFRARGCHGIHEAVRTCLERTGAEIAELPENRDAADWDGPFLLHEPFARCVARAPHYYGEELPKHLTILPQEEWPAYLRARAARYGGRTAVCYCNTCLSGAREGGAEAVHLAELLFPA